MTFGRPSKHILAFALPLIFGNLFQQFYSMADSIIVGQYLGVDALAAVGSVGSLQFLILGFCMGSCASRLHSASARMTRRICANMWPTVSGFPRRWD